MQYLDVTKASPIRSWGAVVPCVSTLPAPDCMCMVAYRNEVLSSGWTVPYRVSSSDSVLGHRLTVGNMIGLSTLPCNLPTYAPPDDPRMSIRTFDEKAVSTKIWTLLSHF